MSELTFSIVIPVQNGAKTIERLLGSLLIQKNKIHEILVCADNCTDNTVEIVEHYKDSLPIKVLYLSKEQGNNPGRARQLGMENATGDWVVFADADDMLTFNALTYYEKKINENPGIGTICAAFDEIYFDQFKVVEHISAPLAWVHAKAFNLKYIREHGLRFHPTLYTHEDKYFVFLCLFDMCASDTKSVFEDVTTYYWCRGEGTIVSRDNGKYPILSLVESVDALVEPCAVVAEKYGLTPEKVVQMFGFNLLRVILDGYYKIQGSVFKWGASVLDDYKVLEQMPSRIEKVKKLTGWGNDEIVKICIEHVKEFNEARRDTVRTIGEFIPSQTICEYLNQMQNLYNKG